MLTLADFQLNILKCLLLLFCPTLTQLFDLGPFHCYDVQGWAWDNSLLCLGSLSPLAVALKHSHRWP